LLTNKQTKLSKKKTKQKNKERTTTKDIFGSFAIYFASQKQTNRNNTQKTPSEPRHRLQHPVSTSGHLPSQRTRTCQPACSGTHRRDRKEKEEQEKKKKKRRL